MMETPAGSPGALSRYTLWNGVMYVFGARTRADSFALSTVADRIAVPALLLPPYFTGQVPPGPIFAFALLDPLLALGAYLIWRPQR
jgi:hypothetical protein